jgi:hypothetical protein
LRIGLIAFLLALTLVLLALAEGLLRVVGFAPWRPEIVEVRIEPGGKLTQPHPVLGYSAIPGSFVAFGDQGDRTRFTHLPNTLRITRPLSSYDAESGRPEIWIFGCSFTYGSGLEDDQTFPWRLQRRLPDYEVVNFGMGGYGTLHSLLQFEQALKETRPKVAVLVYAGFHDLRNTYLRSRRKAVVPYSGLGPFAQPYASVGADGELELHTDALDYRELPLMRSSALAHLIENAYNALEEKLRDSHAVSEAIVLEMHRLAQANGTRLVVANIWDGVAMLEFADRHGIDTLDLSLPRSPRYTLGPGDGHPNTTATRVYADRLKEFLAPLL